MPIRIMIASIPIALAGCHANKAPRATASVEMGQTADAARTAERKAIEKRDAETRAQADSLRTHAPQLPVAGWESELDLLIARYRDAAPSPEQRAEAEARIRAWAEGRVTEAQTLATEARAAADALATSYQTERAARIEAEKQEAASRAASAKAIAQLQDDIRKAKDATLRRTAWAIVIGSLGAIGLSLAYVLISPNKWTALQGAGPIAVVGILGLGLAQLITRPWFMPACAAVAVAGLGAILWWARAKYKEGKLEEALKAKADLAQSTLAKIVPAIDDVYEHAIKGATTGGRELLDALMSKLSGSMDKSEKAEIHATRATLLTNAKPQIA